MLLKEECHTLVHYGVRGRSILHMGRIADEELMRAQAWFTEGVLLVSMGAAVWHGRSRCLASCCSCGDGPHLGSRIRRVPSAFRIHGLSVQRAQTTVVHFERSYSENVPQNTRILPSNNSRVQVRRAGATPSVCGTATCGCASRVRSRSWSR